MLFNSVEFFFFLPTVFLCYWLFFKNNLTLQNAFIVLSSYIFYGWWDWRFLILIFVTTSCSWLSGLMIGKYNSVDITSNGTASNHIKGKCVLWTNVVVNLSILAVFKYYNFFVGSLVELAHSFSLNLDFPTVKIILPVGISFYTFQALSYSIDVYKGKICATKDPVAFFAFVSFFPQLVAGPIERATNLLPQMLNPRVFSYDLAVDGCRQMLWGFFKKIVIADNCSVYVDIVFSNYDSLDFSSLVFGAIMFSFQIYGDFSGYSDIAIGTSKLFGISLMQNFKTPYFSRDIADFWRRWHISLTKWFRDYIYFPLGGSRTTRLKVIRNTFVIFLVSGLWHGANWTFVFWGLYHALLFVPLLLLGANKRYRVGSEYKRTFPTVVELFQMFLTFILVTIGWIIFRSESIEYAIKFIERLFFHIAFNVPTEPLLLLKLIAFCFILVVVEWLQRDKAHGMELQIKTSALRVAIYVSLLIIIIAASGNPVTFIYFQF